MKHWQIWIDTGGTFTDCIALDPDGRMHRAKVLSSSSLRGTVSAQSSSQEVLIDCDWQAPPGLLAGAMFRLLEADAKAVPIKTYESDAGKLRLEDFLPEIPSDTPFEILFDEEAPILAARLVTGVGLEEALPPIQMRLATTRGTNALLERSGASPVLFITRGFKDLLRIGTQQRPDIFALEIMKPEPLYDHVIEIDERLDHEGTILKPIDLTGLEQSLPEGFRNAAIALMHSYRNPVHEEKLADFLQERGFEHISCSSALSAVIKIVPRAQTAVVDAYLSPIISDYLQRVSEPLRNGTLHVMTSAGGLVRASAYHAKDSLLSGPAGGVVGAAAAAQRSGFEKIFAFDMGGTSTDVARFAGDYEYDFEHQVGEVTLVAPALAIESVAAGGGSICRFDGFRLRVGPESAGASPGPACYGAGGPLTITDVNLLLGRLDAQRFAIPVVTSDADKRLQELLKSIKESQKSAPERDEVLSGLLDIANERMASAIRKISVSKGISVEQHALLAFGGAGAQHACRMADALGIATVLIPEDTSLLSAHGLGRALLERFAERQVLEPLSEVRPQLSDIVAELEQEACQAVAAEGFSAQDIEVRRRIFNLRFSGQDATLSIEPVEIAQLQSAFLQSYEETFGHLPEREEIELESIRVVCSRHGDKQAAVRGQRPKSHPPNVAGETWTFFEGEWQTTRFFEREALDPGSAFTGPALIIEVHTTTVVEPGWQVFVDAAGALILTHEAG